MRIGLGDEGLERVRADRQAQPRHRRDDAARAGDRAHDASGRDRTGVGDDAEADAVAHVEPPYGKAFVDVHAAPLRRDGVSPHDGVVMHERTRWVVRGAEHRLVASALEIDERTAPAHLLGIEDPGVDAVGRVQQRLIALRLKRVLRVHEIELALRAEHHVVVEFLRQRPVHLEAPLVQRHRLGRVVVRADDLRVAARRSGADVARLEHRDIRDAMTLGQIVRGREAVHAAADDDDVIARAGFLGSKERAAAKQAAHPEASLPAPCAPSLGWSPRQSSSRPVSIGASVAQRRAITA